MHGPVATNGHGPAASGLHHYGAAHGFGGHDVGFDYGKFAPARRPKTGEMIGCLIVPWLIFVFVLYLRASELRYDSSSTASLGCMVLLGGVIVMGFMAFTAARNPLQGNVRVLGFLFATSLLMWILAYALGDVNYKYNLRPFYDINNLNVYPSVDPALYRGQQLMDAGQIEFTADAHLDITKSIGFKNSDLYCVAPIVSGTATLPTYDFWAVGTNCCSGHAPDFHCGEYATAGVTKGLRLMRDDERAFYRLAVQEAEATYNIKATHPVFMYWISNPAAEVSAYEEHGSRFFMMSVLGALALQLLLVFAASVSW